MHSSVSLAESIERRASERLSASFSSAQEVKAYLDSIKSVGFSRINWN